MAEAFIVLPYDWTAGAQGDAVRGRIDPLVRDIWLRLDKAGFRSTDIKPVDLPGSFAGQSASQHWILKVHKPGVVWNEWDLFTEDDTIRQALEAIEFPAGSVLVTTDDSGRESQRSLAPDPPRRRLP